jgi:protein TonB
MRRGFTLCSIAVHTIVIAAVFGAQSLAVGPLPTPHEPVLYNIAEFIPVDIQLPTPPRRTPAPPPDAPAISQDAAPIVAPTGVAPETERLTFTPAPIGSVEGVDGGVPSGEVFGSNTAPPPPPPPPPTRPMRLHSGIVAPKKIVDVAPVYPAMALQARRFGVVILEAVIDARGGVESVKVLRSLALLDQAAMDAVKQWRFTPALLNGEPVPVVMTVTVNFQLQDE